MLIDFRMRGIALQQHDVLPASSVFGYSSMCTSYSNFAPHLKRSYLASCPRLQCCSERGEMCAMKEVTLFSDDPKSKECAKQLGQVSSVG